MGKINPKGVVVGGLLAGLILNVVDYALYGVVLKADMAAAMQALGKPPIADSVIPWFVFLDFVAGIFLVWLYAAIRPRFGPGPGTAIKAGLAVWFVSGLLRALFEWPMGMTPHNVIMITAAVMLVEFPLAAAIGAKFYTEGVGMGGGAGMGSRM